MLEDPNLLLATLLWSFPWPPSATTHCVSSPRSALGAILNPGQGQGSEALPSDTASARGSWQRSAARGAQKSEGSQPAWCSLRPLGWRAMPHRARWHRGTGLLGISLPVSPLCSGLHAEGGEQGPHFWGLTLQKGRAERAVGVTERGSPLLREGIFPCSGSTAWAARWMQPGNVQDGLQHPANSSALPGPADTQHKALIRPGLCMLIPIMSGPPPLYQAPEWAHCLRAEHSSYQAPANGSPGATQ